MFRIGGPKPPVQVCATAPKQPSKQKIRTRFFMSGSPPVQRHQRRYFLLYSGTPVLFAGFSKLHSLLSNARCAGYTSPPVFPSYKRPFFITYFTVLVLRMFSNG